MTRHVIKKLMIFLFINLLLAIFIILSNISDKKATSNDNPNNTNDPKIGQVKDKPTAASVASTTQPVSNAIIQSPTPTVAATTPVSPIPTDAPVCIKIGPLNAEEKNTLEYILSKNKETHLATNEKKVNYQIYWDLGDNKETAEELFKKQKEGAMSDPKFVLAKYKNRWVVNITKIEGEKGVAEKLTKELGAKAEKLNSGGEWKFDSIKEQYYYNFKDFQKLLPNTITSIEIILKPKKEPC